ncbi:MAG: zinc ribbon domain-containing protein [Pirellulaceae bacterium]
MPTYDYQCDACGHTFELFQGINENPKRKCPECKKQKLRRLFGTGAAVMFKGSGFYQTDYRSESYKQAAAADKPSTDSGSSSDSGKSSGSTSKSEGGSTSKSESSKKKPSSD